MCLWRAVAGTGGEAGIGVAAECTIVAGEMGDPPTADIPGTMTDETVAHGSTGGCVCKFGLCLPGAEDDLVCDCLESGVVPMVVDACPCLWGGT
mmetsp:Transcript_7361/g.18328  ORF Transcript_7361/g.18328 Transcript_7361/m.18328 type:complete len:94 (-) Transcript_7361:136-417(-)